MSSVSRTVQSAALFKRAERLHDELVEFVTSGTLRQEYERERKLFLESARPEDEREADSFLDWFLYDWTDENGEGAIASYMDAEVVFDEADREILFDWMASINSVFEIRSVGKTSLQLRDLDGGDLYEVTSLADRAGFKRGQYIVARLLPLGDHLILSGLQLQLPDRESALAWLEMSRAFAALESPEAVEKAQREQVAAFCELFGCDELTVASNKLNSTLERFQHYLLAERRDPETGMTAAERLGRELGQELRLPDLPMLPKPVPGTGEVTILCDDFDGIVLLPDFSRFKRIFETDEPDRHVPDWKELVWTYIKNPDIPIVAFERLAEQQPLRVEKVLRTLIEDRDFSLEHLYAVLLHYKQPVDGLEDLKDDQQLWDLFNGNTPANTTSKPRSRAKASSPANKVAKSKLSAKKSNASRRARKPKSSVKLKSRRKAPASATSSKGSRARKSTRAKKR